MVIGIVGLGLIGGSLAKAFIAAGARVMGYDAQPSTLRMAEDMGICHQVLDQENAWLCDFIFLAVPVGAAEEWLMEKAPALGASGARAKGPVIMDCCGVKCDEGIREQAQVAGGSFRDMTRVAFLNENVWADLFLENRDNLLDRLDLLTVELQKYRSALVENNRDTLTDLLARGREEKERLTVAAM